MSKIIQLMMTPNDSDWKGRLLGLGDDGVTYEIDFYGKWKPFIPRLEEQAAKGGEMTG